MEFVVARTHEREIISPLFCATIHESEFIFISIESTVQERVFTVLVSDARAHERLAIFAVFCPTVHENEVTVLIIGARVNAKILIVFESVTTVQESVFTVLVSDARAPLSKEEIIPDNVFTVFVRLTRLPETLVSVAFNHEIVPERAFCARESVK